MVVRRFGSGLKAHFRHRAFFYGLAAGLYALGIIAGCYGSWALQPDQHHRLADFSRDYLTLLAEEIPLSGGPLFTKEIVGTLAKEVGVPGVLGVTLFGAAAVLAWQFMHGFSLGFAAVFLVREYAWSGILLAVGSIAPHHIFLMAGRCIAAVSSLAYVVNMWTVLTGRRENKGFGMDLATFLGSLAAGGVLIFVGMWIQDRFTPTLLRLVIGWTGPM